MTDRHALKPYDVELSVTAGRDVVWEAVTQPPVLRQWFGWDYDGLDAEIRQIFVDEATLWAPERMGWADGSFLEVSGDDDTARIRVARESDGPSGPEHYDAIEEGWRMFLIQLRFLLEQKPRGPRRTLYLVGETTGRQALALTATKDWERFGPRVAWQRDEDGHLVVVSSHLPLDSRDASRTEVIVSTYGLDDVAFDTRQEEWAKRWAPAAADARLITAEDAAPQ